MSMLKVSTAMGDFCIKMHSDRAPDTCSYFEKLARQKALDNGAIFRITSERNPVEDQSNHIHVIQFGTRQGLAEARDQIIHESTEDSGLKHLQWTVSAARYAPGQLYRSFFVCMRDEPELDFGGNRRDDGLGHAAFGTVDDGKETLLKIYSHAQASELLDSPIDLSKVSIHDSVDGGD